MPAGRLDSSTISRARLGFPRSGTTTPNAIASIREASTLCRSMSPSTACFASASGPSAANDLPAFTNGVRVPATIATLSITSSPAPPVVVSRTGPGLAEPIRLQIPDLVVEPDPGEDAAHLVRLRPPRLGVQPRRVPRRRQRPELRHRHQRPQGHAACGTPLTRPFFRPEEE